MTDINKEARIHQQLSKAREAIALSGKSPRALGLESKHKIINWIYRWGYTSATVGQLLLNRTSGGYLQKLANQNILVATKTISGSPVCYFTLSNTGLEVAESNTSNLYKYVEIDPFKVNQLTIRHNLITQKTTFKALSSGFITEYQTERMLFANGDKLGTKKPDAVWITSTGMRIALEIELSAKWDRNLDDFILKIIRALKSSEGNIPYVDRFIVVSDSPAIVERYKQAIQPTSSFQTWAKNSRGHWAVDKTFTIPSWLIEKVDFQLIEKTL